MSTEQERGFTFYDRELNPSFLSYARVVREARRRGRYLRSLGVRPGARVALIISENSDFVLTFYGAITAGLVPVPMAPPLGPRQRGYAETVVGILQASGAEMLVTSELLAPFVEPLRQAVPKLRYVTFVQSMRENIDQEFLEWDEPFTTQPDDVCFLQFTSGSTSRPKGVIVTHGNLVANARAVMVEDFVVDPSTDVMVAWLPLYHDMGLIGFVCFPLIVGVSSVLCPTLTFMFRPNSWMQLVHKHRATITFAPNFAYGLVARRQKDVAGLDLSCLRVIGCGAEPILADTLRLFAKTFEPAGLPPEALMPAYGMAENTLANTFEDYRQPLRTLVIDRELYEQHSVVRLLPDGSARRSLEIVSCGKPFAGHEVAIMNKDGELLEPGHVGEIVLRGPSATRGYYGNEAATHELYTRDWMHTGDLGFVHEGNLYVSGRLKDVIIVQGRNLYPQDVEWELEQIPGLRRGGVVAFGVPREGGERVVIVAETKAAVTDELREAVEACVAQVTGAAPADVLFVSPNVVPKTSSGKVQRRKTRAAYLDGSLFRDARTPKTATPERAIPADAE